jgi:hypothetical protein
VRGARPGPARFDIADIVRAHRAGLENVRPLARAQKRVLTDIAQCRTARLGGHVDQCTGCGYEHPFYNSCRNRHCPKCQALAQETWIQARRQQMLDVRHFHVVFTLPAELRPLARFAPRGVFDALMQAAQRTLVEVGQRRLQATVGATTVLHTWTRKLEFHPHVHALVTAGGLSPNGEHWRPASRRFLFSVQALGQVFRGKVMAALGRAYDDGAFARFDDFRDPQGFRALMARVARLSWNVYAKAPFKKGPHVLAYLGRYTHRVGIANSRLLTVSDRTVTFRTKGQGTETLSPVEFLARFVQHVLPDGLHKIRHAGLYASASAPRRELARTRLGTALQTLRPISWRERLARLTGRDLGLCPRCGGPLVSVPVARCRDPPHLAA